MAKCTFRRPFPGKYLHGGSPFLFLLISIYRTGFVFTTSHRIPRTFAEEVQLVTPRGFQFKMYLDLWIFIFKDMYVHVFHCGS